MLDYETTACVPACIPMSMWDVHMHGGKGCIILPMLLYFTKFIVWIFINVSLRSCTRLPWHDFYLYMDTLVCRVWWWYSLHLNASWYSMQAFVICRPCAQCSCLQYPCLPYVLQAGIAWPVLQGYILGPGNDEPYIDEPYMDHSLTVFL